MPWTRVTIETVFAYSGDARLTEAWDADSDAQRDAWFGIQRDTVVAQIRAKVAAGQRNRLDADPGTIPPEFVELAILRLLIAVLGRLGPTAAGGGASAGDPMSLTSEQNRRMDSLEQDLQAVAMGQLAVTAPVASEAAPSVGSLGSGVTIASSTPRRSTRRTMEGL